MKYNSQIILSAFYFILLHFLAVCGFSQTIVLDNKMHHLRLSEMPEWSAFPGTVTKQLLVNFTSHSNPFEYALKLKQEDVKQKWHIMLNGYEISNLDIDESSRIKYIPIASQMLKEGNNQLIIEQVDTIADDISVGQITIEERPLQQVLEQAKVSVSVKDKKTLSLLPCRITIIDSAGALQPINAIKDQHLAVRTGCIYTANGKATFTLPQGKYTIYASRGFEYGADSFKVILAPGDNIKKQVMIEKEVPTKGWIAADPHVHTFTHSFHGDATVQERIVTIAGERIEMPVITDHNIKIDIDSLAAAMKLRSYFTPVTGNEYTTPVGHFNMFPFTKERVVPDHKVKDWNDVSKNLEDFTKEGAVILNHARDIHNNFRPFDPKRHVSIAGVELDNYPFPANAMEVMNSGSQQRNYMQLFYDWFGMLNRGYQLTPVGSSDSHDVSRYLVGQGRTYIKYPDDKPGSINIREATDAFLKGKVMVSFGLLTEIKVNSIYEPGDLVPASPQVKVAVRVLGPRWLKANRICLYANGKKIRETIIKDDKANGIKWSGLWTIPVPKQDIFLVAIAEGPGQLTPFWQIPKPYQWTSPEWNPKIIGASGAVWIDADKDGRKTSAFDYANKVIVRSKNNLPVIITSLAAYDEAVSVQAAAILYNKEILSSPEKIKEVAAEASLNVQKGFKAFAEALVAR